MEQKDQRTHAIIGAAMEVHRQLGHGFLEAVYHDALAVEFKLRDIPFQHEVALPIQYKAEVLPTGYRADFTCFGSVLVEVKALNSVGTIEESQIINYLKASGYRIGLLLNFGTQSLEFRRFVLGK